MWLLCLVTGFYIHNFLYWINDPSSKKGPQATKRVQSFCHNGKSFLKSNGKCIPSYTEKTIRQRKNCLLVSITKTNTTASEGRYGWVGIEGCL